MDSPCFRKCTKTVIKKSVLTETVLEDFVIVRNNGFKVGYQRRDRSLV